MLLPVHYGPARPDAAQWLRQGSEISRCIPPTIRPIIWVLPGGAKPCHWIKAGSHRRSQTQQNSMDSPASDS